MATSALSLPVVTIQHTFPEIIQEVEDGLVPYDKFWVSCYKSSETSVHAKINAELDDHDRNLVNLTTIEGKGDVEVSPDASGNYKVACTSLAIPPTTVITPIQEYKDEERSNSTRPHRITAFDVAPDSSQFATGYLDGSVFLYPTTPLSHSLDHPRKSLVPRAVNITSNRQSSRPHLSGITSLKFFPSSRVLLSSGLDFSLAILLATLSESNPSGTRISPVRTLRGHTRAITSTAIIALGRNVLSASKDATIKLWDVSSAVVVSSLSASSAVTSMALGDRPPVPPDGEPHDPQDSTSINNTQNQNQAQTPDPRELPETSSKVVFAALESGSFEQFDLGLKRSVFKSSPTTTDGGNSGIKGSLTSIAYAHGSNMLATGNASGLITVYDTRSLAIPLTSFRRLETSIEDLAFLETGAGNSSSGEVGLAVATSDGLPYIASVVPEGPAVRAELIGVDCDSVRNVTVRGEAVWCASDDGIVRRYVI